MSSRAQGASPHPPHEAGAAAHTPGMSARARTVIALFGPTGIGKTTVAIALARLLRIPKSTGERGEHPVAISADALQVYEGIETLTGVATAAEQRELEHRLVSFLPIDASFSAGQYAELAHAEIDDALAEGRRPIVVGGTGLYLRAALCDLNLRPPPPEGARERWIAESSAMGHRHCMHDSPGVHRGRHRRSTPTTGSASCVRWSYSTRASWSPPADHRSCGPRRCAAPRCLSD